MDKAAASPLSCDRGDELARIIRRSPATVVAVRPRPHPGLFPADLTDALNKLPYEVSCAVATPVAAAQAGVSGAALGEVLVFARTSLIARMADEPESGAVRLCALLRAGLSPYVGVSGRAGETSSWDKDESDAYSIHGKRLAASFAQVGEAWRRRLTEPPSDRTGRA